ncbi:hypothetical protein Tco_0280969 [Tanacetum coccineum]
MKVNPCTRPNVEEEVKEVGLESIGDVTFEQIVDEYDQKNKADQEMAESPFDTESEIKIIKSFQSATLFGSLFIHQGSQSILDCLLVIDITPKDDKEVNGSDETDSGLCSMHEDELASLTGFETPDSADNDSQEGTAKTFHAFADMPAQSDSLGHLQEESRTLNTKVDQLESIISKKVADDIQSSVPLIVFYALKANLPGFLLEALKNTLPQLIQDSIKQFVLESIEEKLPLFAAQV